MSLENTLNGGCRIPVSLFSASFASWCEVARFALPCSGTIMLPSANQSSHLPGADASKTVSQHECLSFTS